jgi:hypothetical protein
MPEKITDIVTADIKSGSQTENRKRMIYFQK